MPTPAKVTPWAAEKLRATLMDDNDKHRLIALAMANMPEAPVAACVPELIDCTRLPDPAARHLAAVALGGTAPHDRTAQALARLLNEDVEIEVRIASAHGLYRMGLVPEAAHAGLARMLAEDSMPARRIARLTLSRAQPSAGADVARVVGETPTPRWNTEMLATLGHFSHDAPARRQLVAWLTEQLSDAPLLPSGIAGYAALAKMSDGGAALDALARIAEEAGALDARLAALDALAGLGETATSCAARLAALLHRDNEADFEVPLCQTLVALRAGAKALPLDILTQRVRVAEPRLAAAHAMLLTLGGKAFKRAAEVLRERHAAGPEALRACLAGAHEILTGEPLAAARTT